MNAGLSGNRIWLKRLGSVYHGSVSSTQHWVTPHGWLGCLMTAQSEHHHRAHGPSLIWIIQHLRTLWASILIRHTADWNCPQELLYDNVTPHGNTHTHTHIWFHVAMIVERYSGRGVAMRPRLQASLGTWCQLSHQDTRRHIISVFLSRSTDGRLEFQWFRHLHTDRTTHDAEIKCSLR